MKQRILLVDDEESIRSATEIVLTSKGFTVTCAPDGKMALDLYRAAPDNFDVIVTDQSMPEMTGTELSQAIRSLKSNISIILSSGELGIQDKEKVRGLGITAFIQKPWTTDQLIKVIQGLDNE